MMMMMMMMITLQMLNVFVTTTGIYI